MLVFFLFKQKTAYEMRISDWSSDVCSSDLNVVDQRADASDISDSDGQTPSRSYEHHFVLAKTRRGQFRRQTQAMRLVRRLPVAADEHARSEERRVGKECVSTCRFLWAPSTKKNKVKEYNNHTPCYNE